MVILVSEDSNRYAHLFLIEREYFGFNTLESVVVFFIFKSAGEGEGWFEGDST
jgi:hypothetical protein